MVFATEHLDVHWIEGYLPSALEHFRAAHQPLDALRAALPGAMELPVRYEDVVDGSLAALCRRPELLLDPTIRRQTSFVEWAEANVADELEAALARLAGELASGDRPQDSVAERRASLGDAVVMAWRRPG
jgi:hypothetical protein